MTLLLSAVPEVIFRLLHQFPLEVRCDLVTIELVSHGADCFSLDHLAARKPRVMLRVKSNFLSCEPRRENIFNWEEFDCQGRVVQLASKLSGDDIACTSCEFGKSRLEAGNRSSLTPWQSSWDGLRSSVHPILDTACVLIRGI